MYHDEIKQGGDTMTKYANKPKMEDPSEIITWLQANISGLDGIGIETQLNYDGTVKILEVSKNLTAAEKAKIVTQFPELTGKEV